MNRNELRLHNVRTLIAECGGISEFAQRIGMSDSQASQIAGKNPTRGIGNEIAPKIEKAFNKPTGWLDALHDSVNNAASTGVLFPVLDVHAACGDGYLNIDYPEIVRSIVLTPEEAQEYIGSNNKDERIKVVMAIGDSMTPTIQPRDLLFVDTAIAEYKREGIYLLRLDGEVVCKRLSKAGKILTVSSDNTDTNLPIWRWEDRGETDAIIGHVICALPMAFKRL